MKCDAAVIAPTYFRLASSMRTSKRAGREPSSFLERQSPNPSPSEGWGVMRGSNPGQPTAAKEQTSTVGVGSIVAAEDSLVTVDMFGVPASLVSLSPPPQAVRVSTNMPTNKTKTIHETFIFFPPNNLL